MCNTDTEQVSSVHIEIFSSGYICAEEAVKKAEETWKALTFSPKIALMGEILPSISEDPVISFIFT